MYLSVYRRLKLANFERAKTRAGHKEKYDTMDGKGNTSAEAPAGGRDRKGRTPGRLMHREP